METIVFFCASIIGHNTVVSDFFQNTDFICEKLQLLEFQKSKDKLILRVPEEKDDFN